MNENVQAVVTSVNRILNDTNLNAMVQAVAERLVSFGCEPTDADCGTLAFSVKSAVNHVLNEINHTKVPDGLFEVVVDMACGEFMNTKFLTGQLEVNSLDLNGIVQSVNEGDTSVTFDTNGSDEAKLKGLLAWLIQGKGCDLLCYRKMRW